METRIEAGRLRPPQSRLSGQVLVIEQDVGLSYDLKTVLEEAGCTVHVERYGWAALAYVASHTPDLAIVDLRLPDMNGCRLCLELRNRYQVMMVPVVMLTPPGATTDEAYGADAYLTKPIDPAAVITTIAGLMG